jgi:hypothetical protein
MLADLDWTVDDLLIRWHHWRSCYKAIRGFSASDASCQDHSSNTHWDWWNGAADERAEDERMRGVDRAIERIPNTPRRWLTAIEFEARNLSCGARVWSSPVLPKDPAELDVLRMEARNKLMSEFRREGVLT